VLSTTVDAIFKAADKDKSGFLSLEEFEKAGEAYKGPNEATIARLRRL
jgi:Ca2+-binding EF-hand superfamily protein